MATISNTPRPGYVWDSTDNVWYPIGVGAHQHTNAADTPAVIPNALVDAKGDLLTATADNTPARLAVGSNNQVLTVDSSTATGIKWATVSTSPTFVGASVYDTSVGTTVATATYTLLTCNAETLDTNAFHSTSTNTGRLTIPTGYDGKYRINASAGFGSSTAGTYRELVLYKNGSLINATDAGPTKYVTPVLNWIGSAVAGDYFEIYAWQDTGGNMVVQIGAAQNFSIEYMGA